LMWALPMTQFLDLVEASVGAQPGCVGALSCFDCPVPTARERRWQG